MYVYSKLMQIICTAIFEPQCTLPSSFSKVSLTSSWASKSSCPVNIFSPVPGSSPLPGSTTPRACSAHWMYSAKFVSQSSVSKDPQSTVAFSLPFLQASKRSTMRHKNRRSPGSCREQTRPYAPSFLRSVTNVSDPRERVRHSTYFPVTTTGLATLPTVALLAPSVMPASPYATAGSDSWLLRLERLPLRLLCFFALSSVLGLEMG